MGKKVYPSAAYISRVHQYLWLSDRLIASDSATERSHVIETKVSYDFLRKAFLKTHFIINL